MKNRFTLLNLTITLCCALLMSQSLAQVPTTERGFINRLSLKGGLPAEILATRSAVLHDYRLGDKEQQMMQEAFRATGIDAVAYYPLDMVLAGKDVIRNFAAQLQKREIANFVIVEKNDSGFRIILTAFNGKDEMITEGQPAWTTESATIKDALKNLSRAISTSSLERKNLLINETPEPGPTPDPIPGKRNDFYAIDMKVDLVAIPKFGNEEMDRQLEEIISANFPFKYKLVESNISEKDLRKQGMFYILCFVEARAKVAQELLGYNTSKSESAVVSVTYPDGQQPQLRNIPANTPVYKAYFKHIDSGNVFLGTKWDADLSWQSALLNQIHGMKVELRLN